MGLRTGYLPEVVVRTEVPFNIKGLIHQRTNWERAIIRNLVIHWGSLWQKPGYRLEAAWTAFHAILLRPFKYLTVGPLLAYGIVHPDLLRDWYVLYLIILTLLLRAHSTTKEFQQIRLIILLLPLYGFAMNTFIYTKAWMEEVLFQATKTSRRIHRLTKAMN